MSIIKAGETRPFFCPLTNGICLGLKIMLLAEVARVGLDIHALSDTGGSENG